MDSPKSKPKKPNRQKWRKRILIALLVLILAPTTLFTIGWLNRDTVIDYLQNRYNQTHTGTLSIEKVDAKFISGFPNVGFTLKNITQTNIDSISDVVSEVKIKKALLTIGAGDLLRGNIQFKKIDISGAIITSEVKSEKPLAYHQQLMRDKDKDLGKGLHLPEWLNEDGVKFTLTDVKYIEIDTILNKAFDLNINEIKGFYNTIDKQLKGDFTMDVTVNKLGFNTKKGTYFNGARVTGSPEFTINLEKDDIVIPRFQFNVDEQAFDLSGKFDFSDIETFAFALKNEVTDFEKLKSLLPENIVESITLYDLKNPLKTHLNLSGNFMYNDDPVIDVVFSTDNNDILLNKKIQLKNVSFLGHLTTEIYDTEALKKAKRTGYDLKIGFKHLTAKYDDIDIKVKDGYYQSSPDAWNVVKSDLNLKGSNASLTKLINTDNFDFKGGTFQLDAKISGNINKIEQFSNSVTGNFNLKNTNVVLKKNGLQLPIQTIDLDLANENSILNKLVINLPNAENLVLKGQLKNVSALLSKNPNKRTSSNIVLNSRAININEIITLANKLIPKSSQTANSRTNLHQSLAVVYEQFNPSFKINVGALTFNDVTINDLKSNLDLINSETILLHNFNFNYKNAKTNLSGSVVVPKPQGQLKDPIIIDAKATSDGEVSVFQDLFNIKLVEINTGKYAFSGTINGNINKFNQLLNNITGDFTLSNAKLNYAKAETLIEIDSLSLLIDKSNLFLKKFDIEIGALYPLNLTGSVKQFPGFLLDDVANNGVIDLKISAPFIDANQVLTELNNFKNDDDFKRLKSKSALYKIFKDINKFNPKIEIAFDSLKYQNLITEQLKGSILFENDSLLKLEKFNFNYKQTKANITGNINAHTNENALIDKNPFDMDFLINIEGKSQDLNDYLKTKNFDFIEGDFEFKGQYKAQSKDLEILKSNGFGDLKMSQTVVDYKAADLKIPIDSLHLNINNNTATLKALDIDLPGKSEVFLSGSINEFSDFINNIENTKGRRSNFSMYAPYLSTADLTTFLNQSNSETKESTKTTFTIDKLKTALLGINQSFYPNAEITIDTLKHENIDLTDLGIKFSYDTNNDFIIEDAHLNFYGGTLEMSADVGVSANYNLPTAIKIKASDMDVQQLAKRFNYFGMEDLKNADKVEGIVNMNINGNGIVNSIGKLDLSTLNGTVTLDISQLQLHNFKPIMENSVLMKDERFEKLNFRPIVQTFKIVDGVLIIPRTEIQSSAIHLFVEGRLKFNEYMNIWLSLPWKNLKSNDGLEFPEKTTFINSGSKFYIQLLQDKSEEKEKNRALKVKFRLSNRKLRKQKKEQN